jgi:hypothetical protein
MSGEHDEFFFVYTGQLSDHVAGGIDLDMQAGSGEKRFDGCRTLGFFKRRSWYFCQARLLVIDPT